MPTYGTDYLFSKTDSKKAFMYFVYECQSSLTPGVLFIYMSHPIITLCRIETLKRARHGAADTNLLERCPHADVVYEAKRAFAPIPTADPLFATKLEFDKALEKLPTGSLNKSCVEKMHSRAAAAEEEGVPLLVRLGNKSGWFAMREGGSFNRTIVGEWAHVKCDGLEGCGSTRDDRKSRSCRFLQCKVSEGAHMALVRVQAGRSQYKP